MRDLGGFIREQRSNARLSLRKLSEQAGISNPYLSQIERGLRKPSAEILQQIAKALRISAETLYVRAGILDERGDELDLEGEILRDPTLGERHKQTLIEIYRSFQKEHALSALEQADDETVAAAEAAAEAAPVGSSAEPSGEPGDASGSRGGADEPDGSRAAEG